MLSREFIYTENDYAFGSGFVPTWIENANATSSIGHDMLEHFAPNKNLNVIEDELQALGAFVFGRGDSGNFGVGGDLQNSLSYDLCDILNNVWGLELPRPINTRPLRDYDCLDEAITDAFALAVKKLDKEEFPHVEDYDLQTLQKAFIGHMRTGFRKAQRRYANYDIHGIATYIFKKLNMVSDKITYGDMCAEGDRVRFSVDLRTGYVVTSINGINTTHPTYDFDPNSVY